LSQGRLIMAAADSKPEIFALMAPTGKVARNS
jgi:hypothetical protein